MIFPGPPSVRAVAPSLEHQSAFRSVVAAYRRADEEPYLTMYESAETDFAGYVDRLLQDEHGWDLNAGAAPCSHRWLLDPAGEVVGIVRIRHHLSALTTLTGGHIGYDVPPPHRRRGYGTACLGCGLQRAHELGLTRVLVTCHADNEPSRRVILHHGGRFENEVDTLAEGLIQRYWIDTPPRPGGT